MIQFDEINRQVIEALKIDFKMKKQGDYLYGVCPSCNDKTLWAGFNNPYFIQCNRHNNCGFAATSKELFPDIYGDLNKKYPATPEAPNQTADIYLATVRGFDLSKLAGWYTQAKYWHPDGNKGTATVRFYLTADKTIYWDRLIEEVTLTDKDGKQETRKMSFKGSFKGLWWHPPGMTIKPDDTIYIVEGIFDAIALTLNGLKAVSIMSSVSLPLETIKQHTGKNVTWVIALDNDEAGLKFLHRHAKKLEELGETVTAALSSDSREKQDWNDLHRQRKLNDDDIKKYRHWGQIELAKDRYEKAYSIWKFDKANYFVFEFDNTTYTCKLNKQKFDDMVKTTMDPRAEKREKARDTAFKAHATIAVCATFAIEHLYFQANENSDDGQNYLRLRFANGSPPVKMAFGASAVATASEFKKAALRTPGALFTGTAKDLNYLYERWHVKRKHHVTAIDYVGYDKHSKAYIYNDFAVENGKVIKLNKDDYFQLKKTGIKTLFDGKQSLSTQPTAPFLDDYQTAYGISGIVALAWWLGSLFAEQIRQDFANYPFLELVGQASSGKSQMVAVLSKLIGKDSDVFNPNASTKVGIARALSSLSNLPIIFNETDNENEGQRFHVKKFNWDEYKDIYEGGNLRKQGTKTNDNNVRDLVFKGALMIVQNMPVHASEAILSRIVHLQFDCSHHSPEGKRAADRLLELSIKDLSGFLLHTLQNENAILRTFKTQNDAHAKNLRENSGVKNHRIIDNHAKLMALLDCLVMVLPVSSATIKAAQDKVMAMAAERECVLKREHRIVEQFWELFDNLNVRSEYRSDGSYDVAEGLINHANIDSEVWVNLVDFHRLCVENKYPLIDRDDLHKHLPTSTAPYKFVGANVAKHSRIDKRTRKFWVFSR